MIEGNDFFFKLQEEDIGCEIWKLDGIFVGILLFLDLCFGICLIQLFVVL